jgi:hypothetical protein
MKTAMTSGQALAAWELSRKGNTIEEIKALLGVRCSRVAVWRAIRKVTTADERIRAAQAGANWEALCVGELLLMLHPVAAPEAAKGGTDEQAVAVAR